MTKNKYIKDLRAQLKGRNVMYDNEIYEVSNIWVKDSRKETYIFTFEKQGERFGSDCFLSEKDIFILEELQSLLRYEVIKGYKLIKEG